MNTFAIRKMDQRRLTIKDILAVSIFLMNLGALIWGASAINTTVENLKIATANTTHTVDQLVPVVASLQAQVSILLLRNKNGPNP